MLYYEVFTCPPCVRHLVSEVIGLLLVFSELFLPLLHAAVGFLQCFHQLGVTVLQGEEFSLQVYLTHGPEGKSQKDTVYQSLFFAENVHILRTHLMYY